MDGQGGAGMHSGVGGVDGVDGVDGTEACPEDEANFPAKKATNTGTASIAGFDVCGVQ
jgi:hypothetical protein